MLLLLHLRRRRPPLLPLEGRRQMGLKLHDGQLGSIDSDKSLFLPLEIDEKDKDKEQEKEKLSSTPGSVGKSDSSGSTSTSKRRIKGLSIDKLGFGKLLSSNSSGTNGHLSRRATASESTPPSSFATNHSTSGLSTSAASADGADSTKESETEKEKEVNNDRRLSRRPREEEEDFEYYDGAFDEDEVRSVISGKHFSKAPFAEASKAKLGPSELNLERRSCFLLVQSPLQRLPLRLSTSSSHLPLLNSPMFAVPVGSRH